MHYVAGLVSTDTGPARLLIYFQQVDWQSLDDCTIDAAAAIRNWLTERGIQFEETIAMPHDLTKPNSPALVYRFSAAGESRKWSLGYTTTVDDTWNTLVDDWQPDPQHCDMDAWRRYLLSLRVYGSLS